MEQADENRHFALHLAHDIAIKSPLPFPSPDAIVANAQTYLAFLEPAQVATITLEPAANQIEFPDHAEGELHIVVATSEDERTVEIVFGGFIDSATARDAASEWEAFEDIEETQLVSDEEHWSLHVTSRKFDTVEAANAFVGVVRGVLNLDASGRA